VVEEQGTTMMHDAGQNFRENLTSKGVSDNRKESRQKEEESKIITIRSEILGEEDGQQ